MAPQTRCQRCGIAIAADEPAGGVCPACLLNLGLVAETVPPQRGGGPGDQTYDGPYRLLKLLGEGGMGMVYMAEQAQPIRRTVALKLIKPGMDTYEVIARFDSERQALALMDHPNVAQIYDAGATRSGRPYFVMEYVPGIPISEFCRKHRLELRAKLELCLQVAHGVQHAHEKGIIHRDLKPSNVLVIFQDGRPVPKIIDFGLAKATRKHLAQKTLFTETGTFMGTPEYMSPEQAAMSEHVDTRTDIHSLGVLLYELLVGVRPFDSGNLRESGYLEILRAIREDDPPIPSVRAHSLGKRELARQLRSDLDWITMKALEKDPARRYASASELAADIQRYLHHEPVIAGPATTLYRLHKFVRKNRIMVAAVFAVMACLVAGLCASTYLYFGAERRRVEAERQRLLTQRQSYAGNLAAAELNLRLQEPAAAQLRLHACPPALRGWEWRLLFYDSDPILAELTASGKFLRPPYRHPSAPSFGFSGDAATFYWHTGETVEAWLDATYRKAGNPESGLGEVLAMSRDGAKVAAGSPQETNAVRVFDVASHRLESEFRAHGSEIRCAAFSFDARRIASVSSDGALLVWDARSGSILSRVRGTCPLAFSPDGTRILCGSDVRTLELRDIQGARSVSLKGHSGLIYSAAFSRDGSRVVSASADGSARTWDARDGRPLGILRHNEEVRDAAFSPDGTLIATAGAESTVRIWEAATRKLVATRLNTYGNSIAFTPDGKRVLAGSEGQRVRVWKVVHYNGNIWKHTDKRIISIAPGARTVAAGFADGTLEVWDALSGETIASWQGHQAAVRAVAISMDGSRIASGSDDRTARVWDSTSHTPRASFARHAGAVLAVAFSPDGSRLVSGSEDGTARIWLSATGDEVAAATVGEPVSSVAFSPDGGAVVLGSSAPARFLAKDPSVQLWRAALGGAPRNFVARSFFSGVRATALPSGSLAPPIPVAFSPDGWRVLAGFGTYDQIRIYPAGDTASILATLDCEHGLMSLLASPDGSRIVAGMSGGMLKIFDPDNQDPLLTLPVGEREPVEALGFTLGGNRLLALTSAGVRAWDSESPHALVK